MDKTCQGSKSHIGRKSTWILVVLTLLTSAVIGLDVYGRYTDAREDRLYMANFNVEMYRSMIRVETARKLMGIAVHTGDNGFVRAADAEIKSVPEEMEGVRCITHVLGENKVVNAPAVEGLRRNLGTQTEFVLHGLYNRELFLSEWYNNHRSIIGFFR